MIESLKRKTVANGATVAEEEAAKKLLVKLLGIDDEVFVQSNKEQTVSNSDQVKLFFGFKNSDSLHLHLTGIDWDIVAKEILSGGAYYEYLDTTHEYWQQRHLTTKGFRPSQGLMSQDEYRKSCYHKFIKIYRDDKNDYN